MKPVKQNKQAPSMYAPREVKQDFPRFARPGSVLKTRIQPLVTAQTIREDGLDFKSMPSFSTPGGSTAKKSDQSYTGNGMLGISLVHKSGFIPVFSTDEAKDFASMRR